MSTRDYYETAFALLGEPFGRLLAQPGLQELSVNYDAATSTCRVFIDRGAGAMVATGLTLEAGRVEAAIRLLATAYGKVINPGEAFLNLILRNGGRFSACLRPAADGPGFSIRLHWLAVGSLERFIAASWQLTVIERSLARRDNIVAIGATAAGKTSFVNALLAQLLKTFPDERLGIPAH